MTTRTFGMGSDRSPSDAVRKSGADLGKRQAVDQSNRIRKTSSRLPSAAVLSVCLIAIASAARAQFEPVNRYPTPFDSSPSFAPATSPLRSLPPMQALPIGDSQLPSTQDTRAMLSPIYCDSQTLKDSATIRALRFWGDQLGVAVGDHGGIRVTRDGGQSWSSVESGMTCRINDVIWIDRNRVVAVGGGYDAVTRISRGAVLVSNDAGATWNRSADSDLPMLWSLEYRSAEDRSSRNHQQTWITAHGDRDPISGDILFQSRDGGRSWQSFSEPDMSPSVALSHPPGGSPAAARIMHAADAALWSEKTRTHFVVRASCALGDQTLLCAGDHGNILRSTDNGKTWISTNGAAAACGILVIAADPDSIPWSLLGRESLEKRIRTQLIVASSEQAVSGTWEQAAMHLGLAALDTIRSTDSDKSIDELRQWIDIHHPPILAIDAGMATETKNAILQHAVARGCERVVEYSRGTRGETLMHDSALLPDCGALAGDFNDDSLLIAADAAYARPGLTTNPWIAVNTRYSGAFQNSTGDGLSSGVRLTSNHRLPNRESKSSRRRLQVVQGRLKQTATINDLLRLNDHAHQGIDSEKFNVALRGMLDQTSRVDQNRAAWSIARESIGRMNQLLVWQEIERRFPESTASLLAGLHCRARRASLEWREHPPTISAFRSVDSSLPFAPTMEPLPAGSQELLPSAAGHVTAVSPFQSFDTTPIESPSAVMQVSANLPLTGLRGFRSPTSTAAAPSTGHEVDLSWQMHPVRLIVEDAIARNRRLATDSENEPSTEADSHAEEQPAHSADVRRIADRQSPWSGLLKDSSDQSTIALQTNLPPRLDGQLQDACWQNRGVYPAVTHRDQSVELRFAWDDRYIYVAVKTDATKWTATGDSSDVGRRDADLNSSDRVLIGFDIDRDLLTAMNISFTRDGRTHDDLDGFDGWNPTWYVASAMDAEQNLTTEIAIERASLTTSLTAGDSWYIEPQSLTAGQSRRYGMMPDPTSRIRVDFR